MAALLDARPYEVTTDATGTHFILPPRSRTSADLLLGLLAMGVGLALPAGLAGLLWLRILSFAAFHHLILFCAIAWGAWREGWRKVFPGYAEIHFDIGDSALVGTDYAGRSRSDTFALLADIVRLELEQNRPSFRRLFARGAQLSAEYADGRRITLVQGYPREVLACLAEELRARFPASRPIAGPVEHAAEVAVVDVTGIPPFARDVREQPPGSTVIAAFDGDSHTFLLRRWGILCTWSRFISFNLLLLVLVAILAAMFAAIMRVPRPRPAAADMAAYIVGTMLVISGSLFLFGYHLFRRKAVILAAPALSGEPTLTFMIKGPFRSAERSWSRTQIRHITTTEDSVGASFQMSVKEGKKYRVLLRPLRGRARTLASGTELDMRWLATQLRLALNVPNSRNR